MAGAEKQSSVFHHWLQECPSISVVVYTGCSFVIESLSKVCAALAYSARFGDGTSLWRRANCAGKVVLQWIGITSPVIFSLQ